MKFSQLVFPLICLLAVGAIIGWILTPSPLPGQAVPLLSRDHIPDSTPDPQYNSTPPTSGPHSPVWVPAGYYEIEKKDRNLVHSLEHGYVIISYNCQVKEESRIRNYELGSEVFAHGEEMKPEEVKTATSSANSSAITSDESCRNLQNSLKDLVREYKQWKIIAVPRVKLDTRLALTAWGRIDKFNLSTHSTDSGQVGSRFSPADKNRIDKFIKAFRDKGPEATKD